MLNISFPKVLSKNKEKRTRSIWKEAARQWELYLFLLIPLAYLIIFEYIPMYGVQIAFRNFNFRDGIWGSPWVGLAHFRHFLNSHMFPILMYNTLSISLYSLIATFPLPIILALLINSVRSMFYKKFVQMATYLPFFISLVVLVGMMMTIFNPRTGAYGAIYRFFFDTFPSDPFGRASTFPHLFVWSLAWQTTGFGAIIYIAALSAVDPELYEAAMIDGASRFKRLLHIDIPKIIPTISILFILRVGQIMAVGHERALLMQTDLNLGRSQIISTYVFEIGLATGIGNFSLAAAVGLFNSVINIILLVIVNTIARRLSDNSIW